MLPARITDRITVEPSGCWVWQGAKDKRGYGYVRFEGKVWRTHRLMWVEAGRPLPDGKRGPGQMDIDHTCRNQSCCNPAHLEAVAHHENCLRWAQTVQVCPRGHAYDEANTRWGTDGGRDCRACDRDRTRRRRAALRP